MIIVDTDACSRLIRGGFKRLDAKIREIPPRDVCISAVTRAELLYGLARKPGAKALHELVRSFLARVRSLVWSNDAAAHYADIRALLESTGQPLENMDLMIAAHARSLDAPLVTGNAAHFARVPGLATLDWAR